MIVGNGLVAKAFRPLYGEDPSVLVFASGVSNSGETDPARFDDEETLLRRYLDPTTHVVYFSTCSIEDPERAQSPYVRHKKRMELLVGAQKSFTIFRLPQLVGVTSNAHTLTNHLYNKIASGQEIQVWQTAKRHLIDIEDVVRIADHILKHELAKNIVVDVCFDNAVAASDLVAIFERVLSHRANKQVLAKGGAVSTVDCHLAQSVATSLGIDFAGGYVERVIRKYYSPR